MKREQGLITATKSKETRAVNTNPSKNLQGFAIG